MPGSDDDWVEKTDPKSGKKYYFNAVTKETKWSRPTSTAPEQQLPDGWTEKTDPKTGKRYFFNKNTRETRWSAPPTPAPDNGEAVTAAETTPEATVDTDAADEEVKTGERSDPAEMEEAESKCDDESDLNTAQQESTKARTIEDVAQDMLAAAGHPAAIRNPMQRLGNDVLLRMLGGDSESAKVARRGSLLPTGVPNTSDGSSTQLMVYKRLNEEFRNASIELRDRFEDIVAHKRQQFDDLVATMKREHSEKVAMKYAVLDRERQEAEEEARHEAMNDATDPEVAQAMAVLEQRLFGTGTQDAVADGPQRGGATDTQRRLLTFWKAKFRAAAKQLETMEAELRLNQRTLNDLEDASTIDPEGFGARVAATRERVNAARHRHDTLKAAYEAEAKARGLAIQQPKRLTDAQLRALHPRPQSPGAQKDHDKSETASTTLGAEFMDYFITELGHRDPKIRAATAQYYARREEGDDLAMQVEDARQAAAAGKQLVQQRLDEFTEVAGSLTTAAASFYEEIIQLQAQSEATEEARFSGMLERAEETARHATEMATLRHKAAEARLRYEHKRERHLRMLREKDLDLYRTQRRAANGLPVEFTDFTDAPTVDVRLHLDVLKAKLAVTDSEKQLLQHQLNRVAAAAAETEKQLNDTLQ